MSENQIVERVKAQLGRRATDTVTAILPVTPAARHLGPTAPVPPAPPTGAALPHEALQVLTLAQRTAEDHLAAVHLHARKMRDEAQARAEQIHREAHSYAERVRAEADKFLVEARAAAELSRRDAGAEAAEIRRQAELALADARAAADQIVAGGRDHAEELKLRAQLRYDDAVGSLTSEREALQKQIEALTVLDADYRQTLTTLLQNQMRALWTGQSRFIEVPGTGMQVPGGPVSFSERI